VIPPFDRAGFTLAAEHSSLNSSRNGSTSFIFMCAGKPPTFAVSTTRPSFS
jgi:hypothetical protein